MKDYANYLKNTIANLDIMLKHDITQEQREKIENLKAKADAELLKVIWNQ